MAVGIEIDEAFQAGVSEDWLLLVARHAIEVLSLGSHVELSILVTDDDTVRALNSQYRGIDETTDVLSFALSEADMQGEGFVTPPDGLKHLGEVIISYPQVLRQAAGKGRKMVGSELALLLVHGILHLIGYDHDEPEAEKEMNAMQDRILAGVDLDMAGEG